MASMRDIKRRIKSVGSTQQITKAMNIVSAAKLQKARMGLEKSRPFFMETRKVLATIVKGSQSIKHKYLEYRPVKNTLIIVLTSDKGLCGGYNANLCKKALNLVTEKEQNDGTVELVTVGTKGRDFFRKRKKNIFKHYRGISETPFYTDASMIGNEALALYDEKKIDEVYIVYTEYKTVITHEPKALKLLPLDVSAFSNEDTGKEHNQMSYDPSEEVVLDYIIPKYINTVIYGSLVEAGACEQGARMTSMDSATSNAEKMIDSLTLSYNRARQGSITQEITEIVGGANALS